MFYVLGSVVNSEYLYASAVEEDQEGQSGGVLGELPGGFAASFTLYSRRACRLPRTGQDRC